MNTKLLTLNDQTFLEQAKNFFEDLQLGMSSFQIKHFVLNDESFPLPDSKYHQSKLELYTRWQKIIELDFSFKKNIAQTKLVEAKRLKWQDALHSNTEHERLEAEAQIELLNIEIDELRSTRMFLQKSSAETLREMHAFMEIIKEIKSQLRYKNKEEAEPEHWHSVHSVRKQQAVLSPQHKLTRKINNTNGG